MENGRDFQVVRTAGVEGEMELPYAALQQLCSPIIELSRSPARSPARGALRRVRTVPSDRRPNPFLVGLAVLGLLSEVAEDRARCSAWSTTRSGSTTRRLARSRSSRAGCSRRRSRSLFAARERGDTLGRLPRDQRRSLGTARCADPAGVRPAGSRGRASVRPHRRRDARESARAPRAAARHVADAARRWVRVCPRRSRCPLGSRNTSPNDSRSVPPDGSAPVAPRRGRPDGGSRARLARGGAARDPRVGGASAGIGRPARPDAPVSSSVIRWRVRPCTGQPPRMSEARRIAPSPTPPIRRSTPIDAPGTAAQATSMPDEDVAVELERSAARAQARGGFAAAAAFLERSSVLTLDPARRAARALAAAQAKCEAGAFDEALTLAANAEAGPLDGVQRAELDLLRARISFASERGNEAPALLLTAAKDFEPFDARRAREIYLDALSAAVFAGRLAGACGAREVAVAARALPEPATPPARGGSVARRFGSDDHRRSDDRNAGSCERRCVPSGAETRQPIEGQRWWGWLAGRAAGFIWDYEAWDSLTMRQIRAAREAGALAELPFALSTRVGVCLFGGDVAAAVVARRRSERARRGDRQSHRPAVRRAHGRSVPRSRGRAHAIRRDDDRGVPAARRGDGTHALAVGDRPPPQRSGAIRRCLRGSRAGERGSTRAVVLELRVGRVDRGGEPHRSG